jgi:hypothetical protein
MADNSLVVLRPPGPKWFRVAVGLAAGVYLAAMFLGSAGFSIPQRVFPRIFIYFSQVACLFPRAVTHVIDYRVLALPCHGPGFEELDHRAYFRIHANDKESRFHRLGHFYRGNQQVMRALDDYLVERHNAQIERGADPSDGAEAPIGGILFVSVQIPLPEPGTPVDRYTRLPIAYVPAEWRSLWYSTPPDTRAERCGKMR